MQNIDDVISAYNPSKHLVSNIVDSHVVFATAPFCGPDLQREDVVPRFQISNFIDHLALSMRSQVWLKSGEPLREPRVFRLGVAFATRHPVSGSYLPATIDVRLSCAPRL